MDGTTMQFQRSILLDPVQYVKGVGPARAKLLEQLGVQTVEDLLMYFPRRYEDRSRFVSIASVTEGQTETVSGSIASVAERKARTGLHIVQAIVTDASGSLIATWFNQPYLLSYLRKGRPVVLHGRIGRYGGKLQIEAPEYELMEEGADNSLHMGRIVPIYTVKELSQRFLRQAVKTALDRFLRYLPDPVPMPMRRAHALPNAQAAVAAIHFPEAMERAQAARNRFVFEEFLLLQLGVAMRRRQVKDHPAGISYTVEGPLVEAFRTSLPFTLTPGQVKTVSEIFGDMGLPKPMHRLLQGDVGSGKTLVAAHALVLAVQNGYQATVMVPTEILAEQHYVTLARWLAPLGIDAVLLVSGTPTALRRQIVKRIADGEADIIIGTHALLQEAVAFHKLGLVVIDEQHKFGVAQRSLLSQKGTHPDILVMTATPIPRTLAMTVYGDLDVSTIDGLPPGRQPVRTVWLKEDERAQAYQLVRQQLVQGRQAFVIYPLVDETERQGQAGSTSEAPAEDVPTARVLRAATAMAKELQQEVFPEYQVGLLHGRMKSEEKDAVMKRFAANELHLLVSTVIVEVGIDVPNATVMVVEHADRFGLSQLHQLRGRIGRGWAESFCVLVATPTTDEGRERLEAMVQTTDGFEIAEVDLALRGPGEFFGTRQHGLPELRLGNILKDVKLLEAARQEAFALIERDPPMAKPEHQLLRQRLHRQFPGVREFLTAVG